MWRRIVNALARRAAPPSAVTPSSRRDRLALIVGLVTVLGLVAAFVLADGTRFLMPGPLASAHGTIERCSDCHTKSGTGKLSWIHGLVAGDRQADSKACLTCHSMADTAFNAHGAAAEVLDASTRRLMRLVAETPVPKSAMAQSVAFPAESVVARGLYCTTCHQEHQGAGFKLGKISNEQCRSCHVVKFDSFDGHHPKFDSYPFKRRTRIVFDHAGHFDKHFPEIAKKDKTRRIPDTCASCHNSGKDKRLMDVAPFEQTCTACHLDQIVGKERVSGPKGIAFLALPGLDLAMLKKRKASVGEWPEASEAALTPFMKLLIASSERGRGLIEAVGNLNLQDLSRANDAQIKAVTDLVWEIKGLFHALIKGTASDVLAGLDVGGRGKLSATLIGDLVASMPLDVVISAHQHWLPNLSTEMANRKGPDDQHGGGWVTKITETSVSVESEATSSAISGQLAAAIPEASTAAKPGSTKATGTAAAKRDAPNARSGKDGLAGDGPAKARAADQTDDLLFPTEEELRAMKGATRSKGAAAEGVAAKGRPAPTAPASPTTDVGADAPRSSPGAVPVLAVETGVDAESWATYGGWYRQDFAIFYRPTGHKDKFIHAWLALTGPRAAKGEASPATAVFDTLTDKDAQGSCTKCHSVDDANGKGRVVNFAPVSVASKLGRFTNFVHEPHFGVMEGRGCLACHDLAKDAPYLKTYEQGNPQSFAPNFGAVGKELCQTCHTGSMARQDCLLCHKYHVNGVAPPIMSTRIPAR